MPRLTMAEAKAKRRLEAKAKSGSRRTARLQGLRTGFVAPGPSRVPVGTLETKVKRNNQLQITPSNGGQMIPLNTNINQGTAVYNRIGHKFRTTAARVKGYFLANNNGPRAAICGYAWVWDKSPNGATPGIGEIFTIDATNGYDMSNTFLVDDNSDRFKVLKSVRRQIGRSNNDATGWRNECDQMVLIDDFINLPTWCISGFKKGVTGGTTSAHLTGALYIIPFCTNVTGETANTVQFNFTSEVFFAEG